MKKFLAALFCFLIVIFASVFSVGKVEAQSGELKVVSNSCAVLSAPETNATVVEEVDFGSVLTLVSQGEIIYGACSFYHVKTSQGNDGYVLTNFVVEVGSEGLQKKLDPNAKISSENAQVFFEKNENSKLELAGVSVQLKNGQEIKIIETYNKKEEFCKIMFEKDGQILTGFVKTANVSVEGFNKTLILVIFVFVIAASLVWSVVAATKKKRKKQKQTLN